MRSIVCLIVPALLSVALLSVSAPVSRAQTDAPAPQSAEPAPPPASSAPTVDMDDFCATRYVRERFERRLLYPSPAIERGVSGRAVLDCALHADGRPKECQIVEETPGRMGFGKGSMVMACRWRMTPSATTRPNTRFYKVGDVQRVRVPFDWNIQK
jgi:TonB family protein